MNTMQSETPWAIHKESRERLEQYYEGKKTGFSRYRTKSIKL